MKVYGYVILDKATGEQYTATSGKRLWSTAGAAKAAFSHSCYWNGHAWCSSKFSEQEKYEVHSLVLREDV